MLVVLGIQRQVTPVPDPLAEFTATVIDPVVSPQQANDTVKELTRAPVPLMPSLPADTMTLPGGLLDEDGVLHTEARIREINGADEEAMARELRNPNINVPKVVDLILKRCVLSVGTYDPIPIPILNSMLSGDRAALMLAIRVLTFGSDWEVPDFPCRMCGKSFGVIVELDKDISIKKMENPMVQDIEVSLRNGHLALVHLLTGDVQLEMVGDGSRTGPEEATIAIDRSIRLLDGSPVMGHVAQKMSMADRRKIVQAMSDAQPGPRMEEVMVTCTECGQEAAYQLSLVDLFR
jgi:hypothetical protein